MRLCTCNVDDHALLGIVIDKQVIIPALDPVSAQIPALNSISDLINSGPADGQTLIDWLQDPPTACIRSLDSVDLMAPIPQPRQNIICLGWNYIEHAEESARAKRRDLTLPDQPIIFTKAVGSVTGPHADITIDPTITAEFDWEVELGVIIGTQGKMISRSDAMKHVFGYTVINDLSARDLQFRHKQFFVGKSLDGSCPMGPVIVTTDEIPEPQGLWLRSWVNGQLKQDSNTRHQIFDIADTIHRLSQSMTLYPGDIISTGTPEGVGFARKPPEYLQAGDIVECEIENIGRLKNRILHG